MAKLEILCVPVLSDNYVWLLHEPESGATAAVDPAVAEPVLAAADSRGWTITHILSTHHHNDHTGGNLAIQKATGCTIVGASCDAARIPGIQVQLSEGDEFALGSETAQVMEVPGHTSGHIAYWFASSQALFCGDTLFALGCGRLFEGTPAQMWRALRRFRELPPETRVYCAHEYTQSNARFAATVDSGNPRLRERIARIDVMRDRGEPTIPALLGEEIETNPFLRADQDGVARGVGLPAGADPLAVFTELRRRKDVF
ncbi:hydroxyacylglutathione hydrolase [Telmatospirillum sp. J64-1]|uniref:hydroxyacylglutathione hydrolase n=1 Tax=Telmatospirillum sp. J64-1 TaxID=2502183 RepID=UPI00115DCEE4|nr:hydroxyacylglutathione hydrolase [Telmatospirillum sp. J64-1]